jgi:hypothetical protein
MAATYSSFMTTRFYSPVFNTALFDGPLRIYFSQSYESCALKLYHLLQTQHETLWNSLKSHATISKEHVFLMIYPEPQDLKMVFAGDDQFAHAQNWEEGLAIGFFQSHNDEQTQKQLDFIVQQITKWINTPAIQQDALI